MKIILQAIKETLNFNFLYKTYLEPILVFLFITIPFIISTILFVTNHELLSLIGFIFSWFYFMIIFDIKLKYDEIKRNLEKENKNANI